MPTKPSPETELDQPTVYQVRIKGQLGGQWTDWFGGLTITLEDSGESLLTGLVADQAARPEGIGSTFTGMLQSFFADQVFDILGAPKDAGWCINGVVAMDHPTGKWGVGTRHLVHEVAARNGWQGDLGFTVPDPLWPT